MTIADDILLDLAAQAVLSLPAKHALKGVELQAGAAWLHTFLAERSAVGKTTTADHLMQEAVSWSKKMKAAGGFEAFNIAHYREGVA
mgnify:CR=1 FL=1